MYFGSLIGESGATGRPSQYTNHACQNINRVPDWFYLDNPYVSLVQAARPSKDERRQFAIQFTQPAPPFRGFCGGDKISNERDQPEQPSDLEHLADEVADLTEGFQAIDLEALRITSWTAKIPVEMKHVH